MFLFGRYSHQNLGHRGATIIELMAVLAIMGMGIAAMLATIGSGIDYAKDTEDNIKAINIAREGIEGVINIRDTNWLRFSSDVKNCWKVLDYNGTCIGGGSISNISTGSYTLSTTSGLWYLSGVTNPADFSNWDGYKTQFKLGQDTVGFFTQTGTYTSSLCNTLTSTGCTSIFAREIKITGASDDRIEVSSIVRWMAKRPREVIIKTTLTNWRKDF